MLVSIAEDVLDKHTENQNKDDGEQLNLSGIPGKIERVNLSADSDNLEDVVPAGGDYDGWMRTNRDPSWRANRVSEGLDRRGSPNL